ncbi:zinc finger MYM-type protein 2-like isoform X2 [Gigantopelta aegis]|uniref:zinc finger MYM-type protein 2-like isoform X2 n=1 Tax=Gigantopelta aegis TaxID=1735272 RepID=UPI001B88B53E|nr:zinc finger MYM-type protein 2-like isoform X2 [Gigantopelta aegis]
MDKQYSIQFFTKFVEAMQKFCRDYIEFEQAVELSGYLSLEIDNYKKERYVLSEMVHSTGDVISESYCVKAFKTMKRLPVRNSNSDSVLRDHTNTRRSSGSRDLQDSPDHQTSSYNSRTATAGYSITSSSPASSHRHNVPSSRRPPSFAAGGPGQMGEGQNRPMNIAMQIQPRQSQFSSSGMSCDDAVIVSVQTGDTVMGSMGRSSDNAVRAQKRNIPQSEESPIHKKDKLDTDIESLYSAATSIVPTSESDVMKDSYSTTPGPSTSQNDLNPSVSEPSQSADGKEHSESIRLPIPESVTIKEENDIVFLDSPQDDSNNDFDGSQMEGGYGMDDSSHGSQGAMGGTAEDQEMNAHTARKTKAHVKLFQDYLTSQGVDQQMYELPVHDLDRLLGMFFTSVKKENGDDYEPRYLKNMHFSLERHMRKFSYPLCITKDYEFHRSRSLIKARQSELYRLGKGNLTPRCLPLTDDDIELFFAADQLGDANPDALLNTMWFMNSFFFRVKNSKHHQAMRWGDVVLNQSGGLAYLELQKSALLPGSDTDTRLYEDQMTPSRCFVKFYKTYKATRPIRFLDARDPFYLSPDQMWKSTGIWYSYVPTYTLRIQNMMKRMAEAAGIPKERRLTNNSIFLYRRHN